MSEHKKTFGKYLATLAIVIVTGLLLDGGINYFIDPYGIFGQNSLGIYTSQDRHTKPPLYQQGNFNAVLLGNSKPGMIPTEKVKGYNVFNASFGGATPEELYYFADHYIDSGDVAILMLDFWSFRETEPLKPDPFQPPGFTETLDHIFSIQSLDDSIKTIRRNLQGSDPTFARNGAFIANRWFVQKSTPNPVMAEREFNKHAEWFKDFAVLPERMTYLAQLAEFLHGRGMVAIVVFTPMHEQSLELIEDADIQPVVDQWKADVKALFPYTIDLMDSKYSKPDKFFAADPTHFLPQTGVDMLNHDVLPVLQPPMRRDELATEPELSVD
ncbi:hypothetical protein [Cerasicoccus maritimus]|uniref:hypothetical protein n=1 Tax=Cerasicoccus maritimus TaxID=490089 RepID=UPI002852C732|nr:hypothetical protein [Cerasicoccus maritimus]